jgi:hypothetical protein
VILLLAIYCKQCSSLQNSTTEYSTIEETEELRKTLIHVQANNEDNYFILEQTDHDEKDPQLNTTQINVYNSQEDIYNVLFEKSAPAESDVGLYNHLEESDYIYNHTNEIGRRARHIENTDYSCTLRITNNEERLSDLI